MQTKKQPIFALNSNPFVNFVLPLHDSSPPSLAPLSSSIHPTPSPQPSPQIIYTTKISTIKNPLFYVKL